jgi:hypothetical protein
VRCVFASSSVAIPFAPFSAPHDRQVPWWLQCHWWLYSDKSGAQNIQINLNTTIAELNRRFGPAQTPDAEVGFHSEMLAADWFRSKRELQVLQIFSERIPCPKMCSPMLNRYFPGVPWYYYYDKQSWKGTGKKAGDVLKSAYGL